MSVSGYALAILVAYIAWRVLTKARSPAKATPLAAVAGPAKEHWLAGRPMTNLSLHCTLGNLLGILKDGLEYNLELYRRYGGVIKVYGMLGVEQLLVHDPLALQHILVRDQDAFEETDMFIETNKLLFGEGLISTLGDQHKKQRKLLNPVFSLANLRSVLPQIQPIADELVERLKNVVASKGDYTEVDLLPWLRAGTIEYVGRGILGVRLDCLNPSQANNYIHAICNLQHVALKVLLLRPLMPWIVRNIPLYWRNKLVDWLPLPALRELRDMAWLMERSATDIFFAKKAEVETTGLMETAVRANSSTQEKSRLSDAELIGQINTFFLAGQETTTSALARLLWVLAQEPKAQARLRQEVKEAKIAHAHGAEGEEQTDWRRVSLPYDVLIGLPYLDAVVRETLRLYPPTSMMNRVATRDALVPLQYPIRSPTGQELSAVHIPKGTNVMISILGANRHMHVWGPDANEWRPERWLTHGSETGAGRDMEFGDESAMALQSSPGSKEKVRYPGVFGSMMTFFGGSRACLGFKFAEMEIKQILATLVSNMHFALPSATDAQGMRKEIYWRIDGLQIPVIRPPHGDLQTSQIPLDIRLVKDEDFL
ncbi:cytochrome P450 [Trametes punicea]|nr:cytochrome P450 [Trametes punicea]